AAEEGKEVVLRVRDNGVGIPADFLPRIFDLFAQGASSLERSQGGLGIGLTLVRRLVELHGGRVEGFSEGPSKGSEFVVRLRGVQVQRQPPESLATATRFGPSRRVLVVDDNRDSAESLAMLLRLWGHEVWLAYDGVTALEAAAAQQPEVILLDIGLPGLDGHEVARRLGREAGAAGRVVIALTGYGQENDRRLARAAGMDHHLTKPVDSDELARLLTASSARTAPSNPPA